MAAHPYPWVRCDEPVAKADRLETLEWPIG